MFLNAHMSTTSCHTDCHEYIYILCNVLVPSGACGQTGWSTASNGHSCARQCSVAASHSSSKPRSLLLKIPYSGKFSCGAKFLRFLRAEQSTRKLKLGHALVFHMQSLWWVWFLGIETRILQPRTFLLRAS